MFYSVLNANGGVAIDSLILTIFVILGVVIAGAVIIYLLWEAVGALVAKNKKSQQYNNTEAQQTPVVNTDEMDNDFTFEDIKEEVVLIDEQKLEDVQEEKVVEEKRMSDEDIAEQERQNAERRAYLEARRQELIRRMQSEIEEPAQEESKEETVVEEEVEETVETIEETVEEQPQAIAVAETEEIEEAEEESVEEAEQEVVQEKVEEQPVVDALEAERKALEAEKARYTMMLMELENAKRALAQIQPKEVVKVVEKTVVETNNLTLEELEAKLTEAEEKLRATEKEFKQCKKEYIPLRKVWVAHEKDEKKLRRKEALVAKQKVLLYGVNNYADIDEEKAQKLAEDLDLLDGLKLSVQHCEEVMKKNEERYPLLERMYNVLKFRNDELKADIARYKEEIAKLKGEEETEEE